MPASPSRQQVSAAFAAAFRRAVPGSPFRFAGPDHKAIDAYQAILGKAADGIRQAGAFGEPRRWRYDWEQPYTRDAWLDQLPASGALTLLPQDLLAPALSAVGAAIDAMGGEMAVRVATVALSAARSPG